MEQKKAGKSIFLSSYILSEVEKLCDRVGIVRQGKLIDTGTLSELRHLTRVNMTIETERPVSGLEQLAGVHNIQRAQGGLMFQADSNSVSQVVSFIAPFGVKKLESTPPNLEELFMSHYGSEG